jgi:hypothetical protein
LHTAAYSFALGDQEKVRKKMQWNRSNTLALAHQSCTQCNGLGMRDGIRKQTPCPCVFRAIFHTCFSKFKELVTQERSLSQVRLEHVGSGRDRSVSYGRKSEEFIADFTLTMRRTLTVAEQKLFNFHFLLGADWKACTRRLGMDRGTFFHSVYRIEGKLGRVFREMKPYGLFPLDEYFGGTVKGQRAPQVLMPPPAGPKPLRPPIRVPIAEPQEPVFLALAA